MTRAKACAHLSKVDPVMARLIRRVGPCRLKVTRTGEHFDHIVRAIVYQQLSGKAAATIHARVRALFDDQHPTPRQLLGVAESELRGAGLSRQKLSYLKDLAARAESRELPLETIHLLTDEAAIEALVCVKGIGRWTAQMFLMFRLGRPDVLPTVDLGINKAIMREYGLKRMPQPKDVLKVGAPWSPHASTACWYLWRSLDKPAD